MKRLLGLGLVAALVGLVQPVAAADIKIMTQNQYLGADLTPLFTAQSPADFNAAAVAALQRVAASRPADRVKALAGEILWEWPALAGLQEVYLFQCTDLERPMAGQGCDDPSIRDAFVDHLRDVLKALHGFYRAPAIVTNLNLTPGIPIAINGVQVLIRVVDRDVILARFDVKASPVSFAADQSAGLCGKVSNQGCNYAVVLSLATPLGPIDVERGFVGVDATVRGKAYRFINTHLEEKHPDTPAAPVQAAQAAELIGVLQAAAREDHHLLVVGDMNSSPVDPLIFGSIATPYMQFVAAGYSDAWTLRPGKLPGFTCCQEADLLNRHSVLSERIDMLFSLDRPAKVEHAQVVGATAAAKTPPIGRGLWPSDHAAVAVELEFR